MGSCFSFPEYDNYYSHHHKCEHDRKCHAKKSVDANYPKLNNATPRNYTYPIDSIGNPPPYNPELFINTNPSY